MLPLRDWVQAEADDNLRFIWHGYWAATLGHIGRLREGVAAYDTAIAAAQCTHDRPGHSMALMNQCVVLRTMGALERAREASRRGLALMSDEHGALAMVLLRFLAFPPAGGAAAAVPARPAAPLRAPAPPTLAVVPAALERRQAATAPKASVAPGMDAEPMPPLQAAEPVAPPFGPPGAEPADRQLADRWQATVQALIEGGAVAALVRELAWQAGLVAIDTCSMPPAWRLAVAREPLRQSGYSANAAYSLTPTSSLLAAGSRLMTKATPTQPGTDLKSASLTWTEQLGRRTNVSLSGRYTVFNSALDPYREAALTASLLSRF
jgi:hypothetical protein